MVSESLLCSLKVEAVRGHRRGEERSADSEDETRACLRHVTMSTGAYWRPFPFVQFSGRD
jgi:hypothetical protein